MPYLRANTPPEAAQQVSCPGDPCPVLAAGGSGERRVLQLRTAVRRHGGDHVTHPPEQPTGANPESRRDDEPEDATQDVTVVDLADPRNNQAQHRRGSRV